MQLDDIDLTDPDRFRRGEHHEMFRVLRSEDPVHWTEEPGGGFWSITKHADLTLINRDAEGFSSEDQGVNIDDLDGVPSEFDMRGQMMLTTDPPAHTRYRLLVNKGFTPRMISRLEGALAARATAIVDDIIERGECEFVTEVAAELPLQAIADIMGVPEHERHRLFEWSNRLVGADDPEYNPDHDNLDSRADAQAAAVELFTYADELGQARTVEPRDDIVSVLVHAEVDGDRLTSTEFDLFMMLLAVAGNETTRNATAHGMHALLTNPDQLRLLRANPELIDSAVEEILRWSTPVMYFRRTARRSLELRGRQIQPGDKVVMWHISANRDEDVFDDPFRFDIQRSPNDHIAFGGGGAHFCLGANLARVELRLIFAELVARLDEPTIAGDVERLRSNFIGGIKHMPIRFTPGPRLTVGSREGETPA